MIFNAIVTFITGAVNFVIGILPDANTDVVDLIYSTILSLRTALTTIDWFFPVNTALLVLSAIFVIQGSIFTWKIIKYVAGVLSVGILK